MLNEQEKRFLAYWEANRLREKKINKQLLLGLPIGLLFAVPILVLLLSGKLSGKFALALSEANSQSSPIILMIAVICIAVFVAVFYKRQQWEEREQHYLELKAREKEGEAGK